MKKLQVYFRKNTPCHRWIKCSKPVVGDWIMDDAIWTSTRIGTWNGSDIEDKSYSELMDYIYNQYILLNRDKKLNKLGI